MKVRLEIDVPDNKVQELISRAQILGYKREEPRKAWNDHERKSCVRDYLIHIAEQEIKRERS